MGSVSELRSALVELAQWAVIHRWDFVYRIAVAVLLVVWLRMFPMYLLTIYTGSRGIPPFELAGEDFAGVHVMLTWALVFLVFFSLYFWSPLIYFVLRRFYIGDPIENSTLARPPSRFALFLTSITPRSFWFFLPTLVLSVALVIAFRSGQVRWDLVFHFWLLSLLLTSSVFLLVRRDLPSAIVNWQGPMAFVLLSIALPIAFRDAVTGVLDSTLRQYRVGGMLPVTVRFLGADDNGTSSVDGRLLLLGKRSIYIDQGEGDKRKLVVIANSENIRVEIGRLRPPQRKLVK